VKKNQHDSKPDVQTNSSEEPSDLSEASTVSNFSDVSDSSTENPDFLKARLRRVLTQRAFLSASLLTGFILYIGLAAGSFVEFSWFPFLWVLLSVPSFPFTLNLLLPSRRLNLIPSLHLFYASLLLPTLSLSLLLLYSF